jgi:hypothetical protein
VAGEGAENNCRFAECRAFSDKVSDFRLIFKCDLLIKISFLSPANYRDAITSEQEIFMYDITSKSVSLLSGEISSKFVNVAEENAAAQDENGSSIAEQIDRIDAEIEPEVDSSDIVETIVNVDGTPLSSNAKSDNQVLISSGYSNIKNE